MDIDRFNDARARQEAQGHEAEATIRLLVEGMVTLEQDAELGEQIMALVVSKRLLQPDPSAPSGHRFPRSDNSVKRLLAQPRIARSYAGATYQGGYEDHDPYP